MQKFVLKPLVTENIESELEKIGFDIAYRTKASEKYKYKTFKIFDLTLPQANILKQTALSLFSFGTWELITLCRNSRLL